MKKLFYLFSVAALVISCSKMNQWDSPADKGTTTLTVSAGVDTKTYMNSGVVKWLDKDILNVFAADGTSAFSNEFTGTASATYDFTITGWPVDKTPVLALAAGPMSYYKLPAAENVNYSDGILTAFLRNKQVLYHKNSFGKYSNIAIGEMAYDEITESWSAQMKNLCGLIRFQVEGENVKKVVITEADGKPLVGEVKIQMVDQDLVRVPVVTEVVEGKSSSSIILTATSSTNLNNSTGMLPWDSYIYACVLPGEYKLIIEAYGEGETGEDSDDVLLNKLIATESMTITRNQYETISVKVDTYKPSVEGGDDPVTPPAPTKDLTLTLDFTSWPFDEKSVTSATKTDEDGNNLTLTQDEVTYTFNISNTQGGYYQGGSALRGNNGASSGDFKLTLPVIADMKLVSVSVEVTNAPTYYPKDPNDIDYVEDKVGQIKAENKKFIEVIGAGTAVSCSINNEDGLTTLTTAAPEIGGQCAIKSGGKNVQFKTIILNYTN